VSLWQTEGLANERGGGRRLDDGDEMRPADEWWQCRARGGVAMVKQLHASRRQERVLRVQGEEHSY
jgi:hypothetical protein